MLLLPAVFLIHEIEEGLFLVSWLRRNEAEIERRFPRLSKRLLPYFQGFTTRGFAFAALEELILISLFTLIAVRFGLYAFWAGLLVGIFAHFLIHLAQFFFLRRYIPFIITSGIGLIYCFFALRELSQHGDLVWHHVLLWALASIVFIILNLKFVHSLASHLFRRAEDHARRLM